MKSENQSRPSAVESTVSEYVQKSTIHGVAYVGDNERNKFERICWFVMLACSIFGASYLIYQAYRTMKENPIIESPSLTRTPMWEVPFPAVTFCPFVAHGLTSFALDKTNWPEFANDLLPDNLTELAINGVFYSSLILETLLLRRSDQNNYDILTQVLSEINIDYAFFGSFPTEIEVSLQKTITHIGPCLTFNMYDKKDLLRDGVLLDSLDDIVAKTERLWSRDSGFNNNLPTANYTYPFRSFGPDDSFIMGLNVNDSQRFSLSNSDVLAIFHAPDEVPLFNRHSEFVSIAPGKQTYVDITPHLVVSEGIDHYKPQVRQCYFSNERHLKFYKNYTLNHCETECLADHFLAECGCVSYHLPHFNDTKLCTTEFECLIRQTNLFYLPKFKNDAGHAPVDNCNCLPSCTQLLYVTERTQTTAGWSDDETRIYIRNRDPYIKKSVRTELHSLSEFFSNCGGSLGLFLGVTTFSIVELLYFCTVRLYLHRRKRSADSNE